MQYHKYAERVGCPIYEEGRTTMGKLIDLTGKRFGRLTVIERDYDPKKTKHKKYVYWKCVCDCGNKKSVGSQALRSGRTKSCGCLTIDRNHCLTSENLIPANRKVLVEKTNLNRINLKKTASDNTSGVTGVCFDRSSGKWLAYLNINKKNVLYKHFENKQDAINARKEAEEKYFKPILEKYDYEKYC